MRMVVLLFWSVTLFAEDELRLSLVNKEYQHSCLALPPSLLDKVVEGIEFAFKIGAAREISSKDLYHAHVMYSAEKKHFDLSAPDALLFHAQEIVSYGAKAAKLRNILWTLGRPYRVLACSIGLDMVQRFGVNGTCTVTNKDLGLKEVSQVNFVIADDLPVEQVGNAANVRTVRGKQVLFFLFGFTPSHSLGN